jgi:hypothetical protein
MADGSKHKGSIGVVGAAAIGIGGMVGGGIFAVLGTAAMLAGGGTPVAFAVAGVVAALTAYSYARLSVLFPSSGGTVVFLDKGFGIDLFTGTLNMVLWLSYLVTIALYASAFGSYGATFFPHSGPVAKHAILSAGILLPAVINLLSSDLVSRAETLIVVVKLLLLGVVVAAGAPYVHASRFAPQAWPDPLSLVVGGMVIFVAYEGFELIANAAEDVRDPSRTLPRAFLLCVGFVIVLYLLIAAVTVGTLTPEQIQRSEEYALAQVARPALGQTGFVLVSVAALLATFSAINATIYGNARLGYVLAKEGELPDVLERQMWARPVGGVLLTTAIALLIANLVDLQAIAALGSSGFLVIFGAVNAAAFRLAREAKARRVICGFATLACVASLVELLRQTHAHDPTALWIFVALIAGSLGFELTYPRLTGRTLRLEPKRRATPEASDG